MIHQTLRVVLLVPNLDLRSVVTVTGSAAMAGHKGFVVHPQVWI